VIYCPEARLHDWLAVEHGDVIANPANLLNASTLVSLEVAWRPPLTVAIYGQTGRVNCVNCRNRRLHSQPEIL